MLVCPSVTHASPGENVPAPFNFLTFSVNATKSTEMYTNGIYKHRNVLQNAYIWSNFLGEREGIDGVLSPLSKIVNKLKANHQFTRKTNTFKGCYIHTYIYGIFIHTTHPRPYTGKCHPPPHRQRE